MRRTAWRVGVVGLSTLLGCEAGGAQERPAWHGPATEHAPEPLRVALSQAALARAGVRVEPVAAQDLVGGLEVPAEVELNPDRTAHIAPLVPGQIAEVRASLGDRVDKGQVLAVVQSLSLGEARGARSQAEARVAVARAAFARQSELHREQIGSRRALLEAQGELRRAEAELEAAHDRLRVLGGSGGEGSRTPLRSSLAGVVIERHAAAGETVSADRSLFLVADLSRVWVVGQAYQQDVAAIQVGAPAVVRLQAYAERAWPGRIDYVASRLDPHTRTLSVRVELDNPDGVLRPGLFGTLTIGDGGPGAKRPAVPEGAVQRLRGDSVVFAPAGEAGAFVARPVQIGVRARGWVEIERGVVIGERVVTAGAFTLKSVLLEGELGEGHGH